MKCDQKNYKVAAAVFITAEKCFILIKRKCNFDYIGNFNTNELLAKMCFINKDFLNSKSYYEKTVELYKNIKNPDYKLKSSYDYCLKAITGFEKIDTADIECKIKAKDYLERYNNLKAWQKFKR